VGKQEFVFQVILYEHIVSTREVRGEQSDFIESA